MSEKKILTESELSKVTGGAVTPQLPLNERGEAGRVTPGNPEDPQPPGPGGIDTVVTPGSGPSNVGLG